MHASLKALALLAVSGTAALASESFILAVNVTNFDLTPSVQDMQLSIDPNTNNAYLVPKGQGTTFTDENNGINGFDAAGEDTHMVITPGGTATVPSVNVVTFTTGAGTQGVGVPNGQLSYEDGTFTACPASVLQQDGDDILINFRSAGQRTLAGCANIILYEL